MPVTRDSHGDRNCRNFLSAKNASPDSSSKSYMEPSLYEEAFDLGIESWCNAVLDSEEKYSDIFLSDEKFPHRHERFVSM